MTIEKQLKVGDFLYGFSFPKAQGGGEPGLVSTGVIDAKIKIKRTRETVIKRRIFKKNKVEITVEHEEVEARWLPWVPGKVNYANQEGKDVLSGMFTGCWMVAYKEGGDMRVGHMATQTDATDCKAAWRLHKAKVTGVKEFLPHKGMAGTFNLGLVTTTGALYKIQLAGEKTIMVTNPWRTTEEWMADDKGKKKREVAEYMANLDEVNVSDIYDFSGYSIVKIKGPLSAEDFPTK